MLRIPRKWSSFPDSLKFNNSYFKAWVMGTHAFFCINFWTFTIKVK